MIRTWRKWVLFLSLIVVLLVVYNWPGADAVIAVSPTESSVEAQEVGDDAGILPGAQLQAPGRLTRSDPSGSLTADGPLANPTSTHVLDFDVSIGEWMDRYGQEVRNARLKISN